MKQYSRSEVFEVSIASGIADERLCLGVVSFANCIGYWIQGVDGRSQTETGHSAKLNHRL
jgi:hypothetical protein